MKKTAIIQSNYIPWKGYFDIIHDVDLFIFLDDVQYTVRDWRNRNKIKTAQGLQWLTVPVGADRNRLIYEVGIMDNGWNKSHWETLKQNYSRAPYFKYYKEFFENVYLAMKWTNLSELNQYLITRICTEFLGIGSIFMDSRELSPEGSKQDRLIDLLLKTGADYYLSGPAARDYIDEKGFVDARIELQFKDYSGYPEYQQLYTPFEHGVSILDLLFNCGPSAPDFIWGWRGKKTLEN